MASPDPDFWQEVSKWLWGLLLLPVGAAWKKADNSVQKADFDAQKESVRTDIRQLYANAEADRALVRDGFAEITKQIHSVHVDLLEKIREEK